MFVDAGDVFMYAGTEAQRLTTTEEAEAAPTWSPDGTRIMFSRGDGSGGADLFAINANGGGEEQLTATAENEQAAAWSPDGATIAFSTFDESAGELGKIWVMNADGTSPREIYSEQGAYVGFQDWSPDGRTLLIGIDRGGGGQIDLYKIGIDGAGLAPLTTDRGDDSGGRWHPTQDQIVFWSDGNPDGPGIYLINGDGSGKTKILEDDLTADTIAPAWSPTGAQIAWTAKFEGGAGSPIFVMNSDGTDLQQIWNELPERTSLDWTQ